MAKKKFEQDTSLNTLKKIYSFIVGGRFAIVIFVALLLLAAILFLMYKTHNLIFGLLLLFVLIFPLLYYLTYYGTRIDPELKQKLISASWSGLFFIAGLFWLSAGYFNLVEFNTGLWIGTIISFGIGIGIVWISLTKKASWLGTSTKQQGSIKTVYFEKTISKKYSNNLLVNEIVMFIFALAGFILKYYLSFPTIGSALLFIGIGGMILAPIWCGFILPPAFLSKSKEELRKISNDEKFLGAVYGTSLPARPRVEIEKVI